MQGGVLIGHLTHLVFIYIVMILHIRFALVNSTEQMSWPSNISVDYYLPAACSESNVNAV